MESVQVEQKQNKKKTSSLAKKWVTHKRNCKQNEEETDTTEVKPNPDKELKKYNGYKRPTLPHECPVEFMAPILPIREIGCSSEQVCVWVSQTPK